MFVVKNTHLLAKSVRKSLRFDFACVRSIISNTFLCQFISSRRLVLNRHWTRSRWVHLTILSRQVRFLFLLIFVQKKNASNSYLYWQTVHQRSAMTPRYSRPQSLWSDNLSFWILRDSKNLKMIAPDHFPSLSLVLISCVYWFLRSSLGDPSLHSLNDRNPICASCWCSASYGVSQR